MDCKHNRCIPIEQNCKSGEYKDPRTGACKKCSVGCAECDESSCFRCRNDYELLDDQSGCREVCPDPNCLECPKTIGIFSNQKCEKCKDGYHINKNFNSIHKYSKPSLEDFF